jgi:hypothetical protein
VFICSTPESNPAIDVLCGSLSRLQCFEDRELICVVKSFLSGIMNKSGMLKLVSLIYLSLIMLPRSQLLLIAVRDLCLVHSTTRLFGVLPLHMKDESIHSCHSMLHLLVSLMYTASCSKPDQLPDHCSLLRCGISACPTQATNVRSKHFELSVTCKILSSTGSTLGAHLVRFLS